MSVLVFHPALHWLVLVYFFYIRHDRYDQCLSTLLTLPIMPLIDNIETQLLKHMEIVNTWVWLLIFIFFARIYYLDSSYKRCATIELLLFAGFVYVGTSHTIQHPDHAQVLYSVAIVLHTIAVLYSGVRQPAPHHNLKFMVVTCTIFVACWVSKLCALRLHDHAFSAMWHSDENWQRKLEILQEYTVTTYVYYMHTTPQRVKTRFLDPKFIEQWLLTLFLIVVGLAMALLTSIIVLLFARTNIATQKQRNDKTMQVEKKELQETIQQRDITVQKFEDSLNKHKEGWMKTIGENAVLSKRIEALEIEAAGRMPPS